MKKRSLIILLVAVLVGLVVIGAGTTYAWLTQEENNDFTYTVGDVSYSVNEITETTGVVVPGQNICSGVTLLNKSNVKTQLRAKFEIVSVMNGETDEKATWSIGNTDNDYIKVSYNAETWTYNENDGYYYCNADIASATNADGDVVTSFFNSVVLNGNKVGNNHSGFVVTFSVTYQVKQAEYVTWTEMGNIDFSTGLPKTNQPTNPDNN